MRRRLAVTDSLELQPLEYGLKALDRHRNRSNQI